MAHSAAHLIETVLTWAHRTVATDINVQNGQGRRALKDSRGRFDYLFDGIVEDLRVKRNLAIALGVSAPKANEPLARFHEEVAAARKRDRDGVPLDLSGSKSDTNDDTEQEEVEQAAAA
jgi:hypothetical protein